MDSYPRDFPELRKLLSEKEVYIVLDPSTPDEEVEFYIELLKYLGYGNNGNTKEMPQFKSGIYLFLRVMDLLKDSWADDRNALCITKKGRVYYVRNPRIDLLNGLRASIKAFSQKEIDDMIFGVRSLDKRYLSVGIISTEF